MPAGLRALQENRVCESQAADPSARRVQTHRQEGRNILERPFKMCVFTIAERYSGGRVSKMKVGGRQAGIVGV